MNPSSGPIPKVDGDRSPAAGVQSGVGPFLAIYLAGYAWNEQRVGFALTVGGIAGILTQTPAGALVDRLRSKRALIAAGIVALAVGALLIALVPTFWSVMSAQVLIGGISSIFGPAICAVSLGIVGHRLFDRRQGRNQTFNSAGNVVAAVSMGLLGHFISNRSIFFFVFVLAFPTILSLLIIRPDEIDYGRARGAKEGDEAFGVLPVRAILYTLTHHTGELVAIQVLDGVAAAIFGVVSVLVIADLTKGSGRFNLTLGAIGTAAALGILYFFMPETRDKQFLKPTQGAPTL